VCWVVVTGAVFGFPLSGVLFSAAEEKTGYQAGGVDKVVGAVAAGEEKQAEDEKLVADVKSGGAHVGRGEEDMGVIPFAPVCGEEFFFAVVVHLCPGEGSDDGGDDVFELLFFYPAVHGGEIGGGKVCVDYHHGVEACVDAFHKADAGEAVVYFDFFVVFLEVVITDCFKAYDEIAEADLCEFFYEVFVFQNEIASSIADEIFVDIEFSDRGDKL